MSDSVNSPAHYTSGGFEAYEIIKAKLTEEEWRGYLKGNVLKYMLRANFKGSHDEDLKKANWYLSMAISEADEAKIAEFYRNHNDSHFSYDLPE